MLDFEWKRKITGGASAESEFRRRWRAELSHEWVSVFWGFHRMVKLAFLLKWELVFKESAVSRMRESGD